jgi:hypothetical protein
MDMKHGHGDGQAPWMLKCQNAEKSLVRHRKSSVSLQYLVRHRHSGIVVSLVPLSRISPLVPSYGNNQSADHKALTL